MPPVLPDSKVKGPVRVNDSVPGLPVRVKVKLIVVEPESGEVDEVVEVAPTSSRLQFEIVEPVCTPPVPGEDLVNVKAVPPKTAVDGHRRRLGPGVGGLGNRGGRELDRPHQDGQPDNACVHFSAFSMVTLDCSSICLETLENRYCERLTRNPSPNLNECEEESPFSRMMESSRSRTVGSCARGLVRLHRMA